MEKQYNSELYLLKLLELLEFTWGYIAESYRQELSSKAERKVLEEVDAEDEYNPLPF